jgi:hypothetical protein
MGRLTPRVLRTIDPSGARSPIELLVATNLGFCIGTRAVTVLNGHREDDSFHTSSWRASEDILWRSVRFNSVT